MSSLVDAPAPPRVSSRSARMIEALRALGGVLHREWEASAQTESARMGLWAPVALGIGILLYFSLPGEPWFWAAPAACAALIVLRARTPSPYKASAAGAALVVAGFALADIRTEFIRAPIVENGLGVRAIVGRVVSVESGADGTRAVIATRAVAGVADPPARLRVTWRGIGFDARPGELIRFRAVLRAPPPPETPGGFDYAQLLYFERIGGLGFALSAPRRLAESDPPIIVRVGATLERVRLRVTRRIVETAPGQGGALVAASITGDRSAISDETERALRDSGLAHLVAISGLNMALATGIVFFSFRSVLAAIPAVALRFPIKKWSALAALAAGLVYLLLSGAEWSAVRAFIMAAIVFVAILFDRRALTLRNVAVAATIILVLTPEAAAQPGFQMSFAAVTALVAAYEWVRGRFRTEPGEGPLLRLRRYAFGLAATDIVASSATGPFSLFHFGRAALFGLPANMVAGPLMAFILMPFAVLGMALAPFGLDQFAFRAAAFGGDAIIWVGERIASLPHGVATVAEGPASALVLATISGLWLCLMTARWRWFGAPLIAVSALSLATAAPPDILVSADGKTVGVVFSEPRALAMNAPEKRDFLARVWKEAVGIDPDRAPTLQLENHARCILGLCRLQRSGVEIAIALTEDAGSRACKIADLVIALDVPPPPSCEARVIKGGEAGAVSVRIRKNGAIDVETARSASRARPWTAGSAPKRSERGAKPHSFPPL